METLCVYLPSPFKGGFSGNIHRWWVCYHRGEWHVTSLGGHWLNRASMACALRKQRVLGVISVFVFVCLLIVLFTYHKIHLFKLSNSMVFSIFTELCNHHHNQVYNTRSPPKKPCTRHLSYPQVSHIPSPKKPLIYFLSLCICLFWRSCKWHLICFYVAGFFHVDFQGWSML